jgi:hypothetical protein
MANGDNGGLIGGPAQPQQQIPMHKFPCITVGCGMEISARAPIPQVFNLATVSGLVFSHERITRCPKCAAAYICMIAGLDGNGVLQLAWTPINQQQQSPIAQPTGQQIEAITKLKM